MRPVGTGLICSYYALRSRSHFGRHIGHGAPLSSSFVQIWNFRCLSVFGIWSFELRPQIFTALSAQLITSGTWTRRLPTSVSISFFLSILYLCNGLYLNFSLLIHRTTLSNYGIIPPSPRNVKQSNHVTSFFFFPFFFFWDFHYYALP